MTARTTHPAALFFMGLFVGVLVGWLGTFVLSDGDTSQPVPQQDASRAGPGAGGAGGDPHAPSGGHADRAQESFFKVHFMKKFVKALTSMPANKWPNPDYQPLIKPTAEPIRCTDCHDPKILNIESMLQNDPGAEAVEPLRRSPRFMIALMQKWVKRLNKRHADRLTKEVTCTDCHAINPAEAWQVLPPLMVKFVSALKQKPDNQQPASAWKPLLKDPTTKSMMCSVCHGEVGKMMEQNLDRISGPAPDQIRKDESFMIQLMERWVKKLNRTARELLVKKVTCLDCHETDPHK